MSVTLEEHYLSPHVVEHYVAQGKPDPTKIFPGPLTDALLDVGAERIAAMDEGDVDVQVVSHGPWDCDADTCKRANDGLAEACAAHPGRLVGLAVLPMQDPAAAAAELRRCVEQLHFVGALIDAHLPDGTYFDGPEYDVFFAAVQELDVVLYLHPTFEAEHRMERFRGPSIPSAASDAISAFGFGWHADTAIHFLRLYAARVFDRFPRLKLILGHMGELLPFQIARIVASRGNWSKDNERKLETVWKENVWVTTSGMFTLPPLRCVLDTVAFDHILFSIDYPFSATTKGKDFLKKIKDSGLMSDEQFDDFKAGNARRLLRIERRG